MKKNKIKKGDYGYLNHQRKVEVIKTLLMFALAVSVFLIGYVNTGKKENLFTVFAILGMLPASRSAVTCIMFFRFRTGSRDTFQKISEKAGAIPVFYDSVITTTTKSYPINAFVCVGGNLLGYSEKTELDCRAVEKHLKEMAKNNQMKSLTVKIFTDINKFTSRLTELNQKLDVSYTEQPEIQENGEVGTLDERALALIKQLSL